MKHATFLLFSLMATPATASRGGLPFIDDDYARASAEAKARHLPLFVDVWAPW